MGRIGSGEMVTLGLGVVGPLALFALQLALIFWNRRLMRAGKGRTAAMGFYAAVLALVLPLLGVLVTASLLMGAFDSVASVDPSERSALLAAGIGRAMPFTAIGTVSGLAMFIAGLGCAMYAQWAPARSG